MRLRRRTNASTSTPPRESRCSAQDDRGLIVVGYGGSREHPRSDTGLPRLRSGFRRAAQTPRKRLNFDFAQGRLSRLTPIRNDNISWSGASTAGSRALVVYGTSFFTAPHKSCPLRAGTSWDARGYMVRGGDAWKLWGNGKGIQRSFASQDDSKTESSCYAQDDSGVGWGHLGCVGVSCWQRSRKREKHADRSVRATRAKQIFGELAPGF